MEFEIPDGKYRNTTHDLIENCAFPSSLALSTMSDFQDNGFALIRIVHWK